MGGYSIPTNFLLAAYCCLILLASLAGGWIPIWIKLTHTRLQLATSFVAGLMLGIGLLHLLPHAMHQLSSTDKAAGWLLAGFLGMFLIQRFFHFHHHDVPDGDPDLCTEDLHEALEDASHKQSGDIHEHHYSLASQSARHLSWSGAALGLTLHSLIDGLALAASMEVEKHSHEPALLAGFGTFLVIFLHKPFDAMAIGTLMASGGWSRNYRQLINGLFALAIPIGVLLFYLGLSRSVEAHPAYLGAALAFAAGSFLCISASDLLPELQFHAHDRVKLTLALAFGIAIAVLIGLLEGAGHGH